MKKYLLLCIPFIGLSIPVLQDYAEYRDYFAKADHLVLSTTQQSLSQDEMIQAFAPMDTELKQIYERDEQRIFPNFWHSWYLVRRLSLFAASEYGENYDEALLKLNEIYYQKSKNSFALFNVCTYREMLGKKDNGCYKTLLEEVKKDENREESPLYWLVFHAVYPEKDDLIPNKFQDIAKDRILFIKNLLGRD